MARACNCFARNDCVIKSLVFILLHFTVQQINIDKKPGFRVYSTNASGLIELYRKSEVRLVTRTLPPPLPPPSKGLPYDTKNKRQQASSKCSSQQYRYQGKADPKLPLGHLSLPSGTKLQARTACLELFSKRPSSRTF